MTLEFLNNVPLSAQFDDLYFSRHGGWAEKDYVFVQGNDLPTRFAAAKDFIIAELGFGTGLSFLAALAAWQKFAPQEARLQFYSIEGYPLSRTDIHAALNAQALPKVLVNALVMQWPEDVPRTDVTLQFGNATLHVLVGDVAQKLRELPQGIEAWFMDGFSPAKNSDMWGDAVWQALKEKSAPHATAATYSCAKVVRDGFDAAGFAWQKVKGYGFKDGMLKASR